MPWEAASAAVSVIRKYREHSESCPKLAETLGVWNAGQKTYVEAKENKSRGVQQRQRRAIGMMPFMFLVLSGKAIV
jgi:hypothetical protein